jgi:hypothetical protein
MHSSSEEQLPAAELALVAGAGSGARGGSFEQAKNSDIDIDSMTARRLMPSFYTRPSASSPAEL